MKRLWLGFAAVVALSFGVLGWIGTRIYQEAPPLPERVVTNEGAEVISSGDIGRGQNVWQSMGGMEVGSIWGHGSYVAPDWTADWLHREATYVLEDWAQTGFGKSYGQLNVEDQARLRGRLTAMYRTNTYDPATNTIRVEPVRARAFEACLDHFSDVFMRGNANYAIPAGTVRDAARMRQLASFIFWTAWTASTNRPGDHVSYTHNWPHELLVGKPPDRGKRDVDGREHHHAAGRHFAPWSGGTPAQKKKEDTGPLPATDPLGDWKATAIAARHAEVFLGGGGADSGADPDGRGHGALRCRRRWLLRRQAVGGAALRGDAHLARAARASSGSPQLARGGPVHRTAGERLRAEMARGSA